MKYAGGRFLLSLAFLAVTLGASHRTQNFVVTASSPQIARQVALAAEEFRRDLAVEWLGKELPRWYAPCPIQVKVGDMGAGGATSFSFDRGEVFGWSMTIQGPLDRLIDSVLPHEISHTIFACHFRRPLPRWADEGAATLAEHESERNRQFLTVKQIIGTQARIPLRKLMAMKDYPSDMRDVMTLYAEGYLLAELLVQQGGKALYLQFLMDAHKQGWDRAIETHYGYQNVDDLEKNWHDWIRVGSPPLASPDGEKWARMSPNYRKLNPAADTILRAQSPEGDDPFLVATSSPASTRQLPPEAPPAAAVAQPARQSSDPFVAAEFAATSAPEGDELAATAVAGEADFMSPTVSEVENTSVNLPPAGDAESPAPRYVPVRDNDLQPPRAAPRQEQTRFTPAAQVDEAPRTARRDDRSSAGTSHAPATRSEQRDQRMQDLPRVNGLPLSKPANEPRLKSTAPPRRRIVPQWSEFPQEPRPSPWSSPRS